jgi:hypothetical protein
MSKRHDPAVKVSEQATEAYWDGRLTSLNSAIIHAERLLDALRRDRALVLEQLGFAPEEPLPQHYPLGQAHGQRSPKSPHFMGKRVLTPTETG